MEPVHAQEEVEDLPQKNKSTHHSQTSSTKLSNREAPKTSHQMDQCQKLLDNSKKQHHNSSVMRVVESATLITGLLMSVTPHPKIN